ncbi:DUF305 domain-containing protein [Plantactinospora sp. KLBMP9567]|uniref:DUF305 domain-containing protein n=1 Tax=Plantactinospora sp. KLBMP9567 TaxID=3085900 RepID=UPI00298194FA|nr:DUF305 domain-containing protein [Plantactinospora sp. KLBMP9567]MDW5327964.1 DUF305 domain-containing protein [Plantactinospora sp. KLBMP9567]
MRSVVLTAAAIGAVAVTAACGGDGHGSGHTAERPAATATSAPVSTTGHNQADIAFAQGMIPHHRQAVQMVELAERRAGDPQVKSLAGKIKTAQQPEIDQMTAWLREWGAPTASPSVGGHSMHGIAPGDAMPGMMTAEDMTAMERASGNEFDRMFLEMMIRHHQGAVQMASTEMEQGQNPAAKSLAEKIKADQTAEISQMRNLLNNR